MQNKPLPQPPRFNVPPEHRTDLIRVCHTSLVQAREHLEKAATTCEPLLSVAQSCINAFTQTVTMIKQDGQIPVITSGHDSHDLEAPECNALQRSLSSIYGFQNLPTYERTSPHSIAALKALQPIEKRLFDFSLTFST